MKHTVSLPALAAVTCWSTMGPFAKYAFDYFPANAYLGIRPIIATIAAFALLRLRSIPLGISRPAWPRLLACGAFGYGVAQTGFIKGLDLTSVSHHSVLAAASPLIATLALPVVYRTRPQSFALAGSALGFLGVALLVGGGGAEGSSVGGDLFVLLSAAVWVGATMWPIPLMARYGVETVNAWMLALSLIVILPLTAPDVLAMATDPPNWIAWLAVFHGGLVGILLGNVLWHKAVRESGLDATMVYQYLTPVLSLALAIAFLGERPTLIQVIGSVLILAGVVIVHARQTRRVMALPQSDENRDEVLARQAGD